MVIDTGELKKYLERIPDDYEVYIEDVRRVGAANPEENVSLKHVGYDDQDFLTASPCFLTNHEKKVFCICHHI